MIHAAHKVAKVQQEQLVAGEFALTSSDFGVIARLLQDDSGIHLPAWKANLVYARLAPRLRTLGHRSFREYCDYLREGDDGTERRAMCAALTTNVTRFFREPHHFAHLEKGALPLLLDMARKGQRIRMWSAACSSGEEPYSMALTVLSLMPDALRHDIKILATDINSRVLETGRRGVYDRNLLTDIPAPLRQRWFGRGPTQETMQIADEVRALVEFRELNLIDTWKMKAAYQVVFCRNVVIYFEEETRLSLWQRLAGILAPDGWLYIGHSERVTGRATKVLEGAGVTTYRKLGAGAP